MEWTVVFSSSILSKHLRSPLLNPASSGNYKVLCLLTALGAGAWGTGCVRGPQVLPAPGGPGHCLRLLGLNEAGGAAVEERGAPAFVGDETPIWRYHLTPAAGAEVTTLDQAACEEQGLCPVGGPLSPGASGLLPVEQFGVGEAGTEGEVLIDLPGLGPTPARLGQSEDRHGELGWHLALGEGPDAWVFYRAPLSLDPVRIRYFRAGSALWWEVESASRGVACLVESAHLPRLSAGILGDRAVSRLEAGDLKEAEALLRRALEVWPEDPTAAYNLACTLARGGRPDEAMALLERAFLVDPHHRLRRLAPRDPDLESLRSRADFRFLVAP